MKIKSYSLQEKIEFFQKNKWGEDQDYKSFYRDDTFPEREMVRYLTNDELIKRYLEWVDRHMDDDKSDKKYFGGYALHCRYEMGRRLREGIGKFERSDTSGKTELFSRLTKDDDLFNNALPAFEKTLQNFHRDREEELSKRFNEVIVAKARLGKLSDPIFPRYALYQEHAPKIGQDFLIAFDSIVKPHCGFISDASSVILLKLFYERYRNVIAETERSLRRVAVSQGREEKDMESIIAPARSIYQASQSKYHDRLEAEILKHNLGKGVMNKGAEHKAGPRPKKRKMSKNQRKLWTGNKSEFCRHVKTKYKASEGLYRSERDATFKLFKRYRFADKKWTAYKCYELLKRVK